MSAELTEIFADLHDLKIMQIQSGKVKPSKRRSKEINEACQNSITHALKVAEYITAAADKWDYVQAYLNMTLQAASKYTKLICATKEESIQNHKHALDCYQKAKKFTSDFQKETGKPMTKEGDQQIKICEEMIEMLPIKITKIQMA